MTPVLFQDECLRKAEWFSGSLENLPTQLYSNAIASRKRRLIAIKSEPEDSEVSEGNN